MGGYGLWQIEHRGEFRLALRRATSLPRGNKRDYVSYKTLVRWRFACALRGSARGFWFIDPLGLRPRGLCTVATRACHVNHAPPSYNHNIRTIRACNTYECQFVTLWNATVHVYTVKPCTAYMRICSPTSNNPVPGIYCDQYQYWTGSPYHNI